MIRPDLPQRSKSRTISCYAMAVLSVAVAMVTAEFITRLLHAEPIALSMLCAVIFTAWFGGFGPALVAITLSALAFHYYVVPPINSFTWKHNIFVLDVSEVPRFILFLITSVVVSFVISSQKKTTEALRRAGDDLRIEPHRELRMDCLQRRHLLVG
jgi:K+-sensing histidine kinase KdpD